MSPSCLTAHPSRNPRPGLADRPDGPRALHDAGHHEQADRLERELVDRNVIDGRWTFQVVEEYDDHDWSVARDLVAGVQDDLADGARHVHEAEMKADRITPGHARHRPTPPQHD